MLTLIKNAQIFTPRQFGIGQLLIGGGRVLAIDRSQAKDAWPGCDVIDAQGAAVVPGFIDGHAHITGGGGESGFASQIPPLQLSRFTLAGVTSVIGLLGTDDTTRTTRSVVARAYALREQGLGAWCYTGGYHLPPTTLTGSVRDDIVFIDPILGVGELAISDHRSSQPTLNELLRIAGDAHVAGMMAAKAGTLHCHLGDGQRGLELIRQAIEQTELPARVFNPTHINRRKALFEEAIDLAQRGCVVDITAFPPRDDEDHWPADVALIRYLDSGAPTANITISSDGGGCIPTFDGDGHIVAMAVGNPATLNATFRRLIGQGVPMEQALAPFTSNVAALLRLSGRGELAVGAVADLLLVEPDGAIRDVMANGIWQVRAGRAVRLGPFEQGRPSDQV